MKALFGLGTDVPLARVIRDYRSWVVAVAILVAINLGVLVGVVLPLSAAAENAEQRAAAAEQARTAAGLEKTRAEQTRDAQGQAARDLDRFYKEVLPADVAAARRVTHLKLSQMAREHRVTFQRSSSQPEALKDSTLERLRVSYSLAGDYDDIRRFIHDIETAADFIVIDNVFLEGEDEQAPLSLALELSTFYRARSNAP